MIEVIIIYHTNAFMLQAVIYNSKVGKTIVEKTADSLKKLAVAVNKSLIDYQKPAIEKKKYNEPSKANILKVYDEIEKNQIFGTKEIKEILDCSPSTARAVMTKLRDMKVVKAVNGKGKVCIHRIKMRYRVFLNVKALCVEVRRR